MYSLEFEIKYTQQANRCNTTVFWLLLNINNGFYLEITTYYY